MAERISTDHVLLGRRLADIVGLSASVVDAPNDDARRLAHQTYLDLGRSSAPISTIRTSRSASYAALEQAIGVEAVIAIHTSIIGSIPPDVMMRSLALMLPAMNVDDRTELLGGMRATAPLEAFGAVLTLAEGVLRPADFAATVARVVS